MTPVAYDDTEAARRVATRAMSLIRADADPDAAVTVLLGFVRGHLHTLELARARCAAAVDQDPHDRVAGEAVALLDRVRATMG